MKTVNVTYFKSSGQYFDHDIIEIPKGLNIQQALEEVSKKRLSDKMYMLIQDSGDHKEPYIVPHLFSPTSYWE